MHLFLQKDYSSSSSSSSPSMAAPVIHIHYNYYIVDKNMLSQLQAQNLMPGVLIGAPLWGVLGMEHPYSQRGEGGCLVTSRLTLAAWRDCGGREGACLCLFFVLLWEERCSAFSLFVRHICVAHLGDCVCVCVCVHVCVWGGETGLSEAGGSFSCVIRSWGVGGWVGVCVRSLAECVCRAGVPQYRV
jgi:hypothetical protein